MPTEITVSVTVPEGGSAVGSVVAVNEETGVRYTLTAAQDGYTGQLPVGVYTFIVLSEEGYAATFAGEEVGDSTDFAFEVSASEWIADGGWLEFGDVTGITDDEWFENHPVWTASENTSFTSGSFAYIHKLALDMPSETNLSTDVQFVFANGNDIRLVFIKWGDAYRLNFRVNGGSQVEGANYASSEVIQSFIEDKEAYLLVEVSGTTLRAWPIDLEGNRLLMQTQTCAWLENTTLVNIGVKKGTEDTDFSTTLNVTEIYLGIDKTADEMLAHAFDAQEVTVTNNAESLVTVTGAPDGTYTYGETVTLVLTVAEGNIAIVTHNGAALTAEAEGNTYTYTFAASIANVIVITAVETADVSVTVNAASGMAAVASVTLEDEYGNAYELASAEGVWTAELPNGEYTVTLMTAEGFTYILPESLTVAESAQLSVTLDGTNWVEGAFIDVEGEKTTTEGSAAFNTTLWSAAANTSIGSEYTFFSKYALDIATLQNDGGGMTSDFRLDFANGSNLRITIWKSGGGTGYGINFRLNNAGATSAETGRNLVNEAVMQSWLTEKEIYVAVEVSGTTISVYFIDGAGNSLLAHSMTYDWLDDTTMTAILVKKGTEDTTGAALTVSEISVGVGQTLEDILAEKFPAEAAEA